MYNVSDVYIEQINSSSKEVYWYGNIILTNGTYISFDESHMKQGQTTITRQLNADSNTQIGSACSSELKITFMLDYDGTYYYLNGMTIYPQQFYDAEISLYFRLYFDESKESYEDVPLGTFIVAEPKRTQTTFVCTAYDYMQKFTANCVSSINSTPYNALASACSVCGVSMGSSAREIYNMTNGRTVCAMYDPKNGIKTWRDVIAYIAAMLCGNAIIKADNKLYIIPYSGTDDYRVISPSRRISLEIEDYWILYSQVSMVNLRTNVIERVGGNYASACDLGENPLMQWENESAMLVAMHEIYAIIANTFFTPFKATLFTDPSFELGDKVLLTGNHCPDNTYSKISTITINVGSHMSVACEGENPYQQKALESSSTNTASDTSGSTGTGVTFYDYVSGTPFSIDTVESYIYDFQFPSNGDFRYEFNAELKLSIVTSGTVTITVYYYLNGELESYTPQYQYFNTGTVLLHLFYLFYTQLRIEESTFSFSIAIAGGTGVVSHVYSRLMVSGDTYPIESTELAYIEVSQQPTKTFYRVGETLDFTGLVVNAYYTDGSSKDITSLSTYNPANGSTVSSTAYITVGVTYVENDATYTTEFALEVYSLESIYVQNDPTKMDYFVGETIDLSGISVIGTYTDGSTVDVTSGCTFNPASGTEITRAGRIKINISYTDIETKTTYFYITSEAIVLEGIAVTNPPTITSYWQGDYADYSGIVVTATYSDGTTKDVTSDCTYSPSDGSQLTSTSVTSVLVSYTEDGITYTDNFAIEVKEPVFDLKYLNYTIDNTNHRIYVSGITSEVETDNITSLVIPNTYTDEESGITYEIWIEHIFSK